MAPNAPASAPVDVKCTNPTPSAYFLTSVDTYAAAAAAARGARRATVSPRTAAAGLSHPRAPRARLARAQQHDRSFRSTTDDKTATTTTAAAAHVEENGAHGAGGRGDDAGGVVERVGRGREEALLPVGERLDLGLERELQWRCTALHRLPSEIMPSPTGQAKENSTPRPTCAATTPLPGLSGPGGPGSAPR